MYDFRSDTVTKPTKEMRAAMANALVGDDVYGEDVTINELEVLAAKMTGKEASLFVPSGTMGNQLSIFTHTRRSNEIIVGSSSHIKTYEVGSTAVISAVNFHTIQEIDGMMPLHLIEAGIRSEDIHYPETSLICLENAHGSGKVLPLDYMENVYKLAKANNLAVHLDGARLFNASTYLNCDVKEICAYTDSVTFCLSKGLCAPIGSMLCGTKDFIQKARKGRKLLGAGMRQVGILGAAGLIGLHTMSKRLEVDHKNATYLAQELDKIEGFTVDFNRLDINMVFVKTTINVGQLSTYLKTKDMIIGGYSGEYLRIAVHNDISLDAIHSLLEGIKHFKKTTNG
jgi:threonine aldolase